MSDCTFSTITILHSEIKLDIYSKRVIILYVKRILSFATACLIFAAGVPFSPAYAETVSFENKTDINELSYTEQRTYGSYFDEYINVSRPETEIKVMGVDYSYAENGQFFKGDYEDRNGTSKNDVLIWNSAEGELTYQVNVRQSGVYNLFLSYCALETAAASIEMSILIDGKSPYDSASRITLNRVWVNEKPITENASGNQTRPTQVQYSMWQETAVKDPDGLFNDPLMFYFEKGVHTLTFKASKAYIALEYFKLFNQNTAPSYIENKPSDDELSETPSTLIRIEGEDAVYKSDPVLYPTSDKSSYLASPARAGKIIYNTIGDGNWKKSLQTITWKIPSDEIKEDGWYRLGIKARQQYMRGLYSNRRIYIDGEVPYDEFEQVRFYYDTDWQLTCPEDANKNSVYVYLTAGEDHTISMEAVPGEIGGAMRRLEPIVYDINEYYRKILMITGPSPDKYNDYNVDRAIPELVDDFKDISGKLKEIKVYIEDLAQSKGSEAAGIERMYVILDKCIEKPARIPQYLTQLKDNAAAISSWMRDYRDQPLEIDYIEIASADMKFSDTDEKFFKSFEFGVKAFFTSFFEDYSIISNETGGDALNVWINLGRDQALAIKELVESDFIPQYGIPVNLNIVQGGVVEAALAGKGPDIALFLGGEYPLNLAARGLLEDMSRYDGFDELRENFHEDAMVMYSYDDGVYGIPLEQTFPVMFYRKDILSELGVNRVPETWDELIDTLPALQRNHMYAGLVLPPANIAPSTECGHTFALLMLQNGLNYYNEDMTATSFDDIGAVRAFEKWTDFYTKYKFEQVYDPFSRFRDGTYPIVIQGYTFYNQLKAAAPEINGLWDFTAVPGTVLDDGTVSHAANSSGNGAVMFTGTKNKDDAWQFIKWFSSVKTQTSYGMAVEGLLGTMGRYDAANVQALSQLSWTPAEYKKLMVQWNELDEIPIIPASYAVTRNIMTAFRATVNDHENPRDTIMWYNRDINAEIARKRENLGLEQ